MAKILVFDSGLGGLSIVSEIKRLGLDLDLDYFADNAFFPYGDKSDLVLIERIPQLIKQAVEKTNADLVVIACNTASTIALYRIRQVCNIPIIGVVPAIKPACKESKTKKIGVLATPRTIGSAYFDQLIEDFNAGCEVFRYGPPELAKAAENFLLNGVIENRIIKDAIDGIMLQKGASEIDKMVLACTHYPFLKDFLALEIEKSFPNIKIDWIDSSNAIARRIIEILGIKSNKISRLNKFFLSGEIDDAHSKIAIKFGFSEIKKI